MHDLAQVIYMTYCQQGYLGEKKAPEGAMLIRLVFYPRRMMMTSAISALISAIIG